jgi:hypothetical protein
MTSHTEQGQPLGLDERAELERLRTELTQLRAESASVPPQRGGTTRAPRRWWRRIAATVLIVLSCLLAPLSVVAVWARSEVTDTDRYVDTVAPLAHDPAIQHAVTENLTNVVFQYIDVQGITTQALGAVAQRDIVPPAVGAQLQALAIPIADGVRSFVGDRIEQLVTSDVFAQAWEEANRSAHEQLVAALSGQGGAVTVQNNAVSVNLATFVNTVKQRLIDRGFTLAERIPTVNATFTIFESADVGTVQKAFNLLDTVGYWLPLVLVAMAGLGIYLAPNHRRAFIGTGLGVALAALATALALQYARSRYLQGVPPAILPPDAAAVLFDTIVRYLREAIRSLALVGLLFAIGAFLTGPSVTARTVRGWCTSGIAAAKGGAEGLGLRMGDVTRWVGPRAKLLRGIVVAAAFAVVLLERYRTPGLVLWLTAGLLVALAVIEFLAVQPRSGTRPRPAPMPVPAAGQ